MTKTLKQKASFRPQRVLRELGETSDTTIDRNSIILKFLTLDAYLGFIVLWARSRVPPSKSQSDRMRSKASFEGTYVGVMVEWNAGEIFGIVVDGGGGGTPSKSNADQFSRGDRQGEGTSWPENRPGAEGPKLLGNSPGEEEAGAVVGMKSCYGYAHGMARNN